MIHNPLGQVTLVQRGTMAAAPGWEISTSLPNSVVQWAYDASGSEAVAPQSAGRGEGIIIDLHCGRRLRLPETMTAERVVSLIRVLAATP